MADIEFRVDAVLGDTSQLKQQIQNLQTNLNLTINNTQALQAIQQVQQQINNLINSARNINLGNLNGGGQGNGGGIGNTGGSANARNAVVSFDTLQKTESLYQQISSVVSGTVQQIQVMRNEQGQIVSGTVTVTNGVQTWRRNLEFVDGEYKRIIASGRDTISEIQKQNENYKQQLQLTKEIESLKSRFKTADSPTERMLLKTEMQRKQNMLSQLQAQNDLTSAQQATIAEVQKQATLERNLAEIKRTQAVRQQEQNENYRQQLSLTREIESLKTRSQTATPAEQTILQAEMQRKEAMLSQLQLQGQLTAQQQQEITEVQREAQLEREILEIKRQQLNASYGSVQGTGLQGVNTDELVKQTQWFQKLNAQYQGTAQIVDSVKMSTNQYGESLAQCTVKVKTADNQWVKYKATINNTTGDLRVLKGQTTEIINSQMNLSTMITSAIERFAAWGLAMKFWTSITNGISDCINYVKDLNEAMTDIRIVTMDTQEATESLLKTYNEIGQTLGASTTDVASGAVDWLRQGYNTEDTETLVTDSTVLSRLALIDNAEATEYLTSALKGYKLEAEDAIGVIDQLVSIDLEAATSAGDMAEAMSRTANMARTTGVEMNELLGMIATMSEVTQNSASTIGNSMKTIFSRMSNVAAGKDIDEAGESLNDVEATLNRVGIALRDENNNWYDFYDVLDEVASRWSEFNEVQQSQITTALGGTRQRENILVILENWDKVKQYAETGANASGTAMQKYEVVLESVATKQAQLTAKTEEFYANVLNSGFITGLLDIGSALMDIINLGDGLVGKLLLLSGTTLAWIVILNTLKGVGVTSFTALIAKLTGVTIAEGAATAGAQALNLALQLIEKHPIIFAISALIAVVMTAVTIFNELNVTLEEQKEIASQAQQEYKETANALKEVNDELATTRQRMIELESKGSLTFVEQEELEQLRKTNAELEKRQYWLDIEAKQKKKESNEAAKGVWDKDFNEAGEYESRYNYTIRTGKVAGEKTETKVGAKITETEYIKEQIQYYTELETKIAELVAKRGEWTEAEKKEYDSLIKSQQAVQSYLESTGARIQTDYLDAYDVDDATRAGWIELQDIIQKTLDPDTVVEKFKNEVAALPKHIQDNFKFVRFESLEEAFTIDGELDTEALENFKIALAAIGIVADDETVLNYINQISAAVEKIPVTPLKGLAEIIDEVEDKADALGKAEKEMSNGGYLTIDTVKALSEEFDGLEQYLILTENGYQITKEGLDALNESMMAEYEIAYNNAISAANTIIDTEALKAAGYDTTTMSIYAQLQAMEQLAIAKGQANVAEVQKKLEGQGFTGAMLSNHPEYKAAVSAYKVEAQAYADAAENVKNATENRDKARELIKRLTGGGKDGGSGSGSKGKEQWEIDLDNLKKQLEYGEISMDTYISGLQGLLGKVVEGSDAWREINAELQKAKLDNIENQFDRGEITIDEYIAKLTALRDTYLSTSEEYKELTKTINETKADKYADQYERGQISLNAYINRLAELRDSYVKNSEEWKKYNDLINDTKTDTYEKQFDREEISAEQYIAKLKEIQKAYDKDSEAYKELQETIEDTQLDATEKWIEKLQRGRDEIESAIDQLGEVNTVKEQTKYAELLSKQYKAVQSDITKIQNKLKSNNLTAEERITLQEELNDLLKEEADIHDEIEDEVRDYYENQKAQAEKQAELHKKQVLYQKELELYGKQGKELYEYYTQQQIDALQALIDQKEKEKEAQDKINEREELQNNLLEARIKLQEALNNKTTKILKKQEDGSWQYEYSANMSDVKAAKDEVDTAQKALDDFNYEQEIAGLQDKIDKATEAMNNLAEQYEDAEFWADRDYEKTMNNIAQTFEDIDELVEKWMATYGQDDSSLTKNYQSLVKSNSTLKDALVSLEEAIESKYETVGKSNNIIAKNGVTAFDTGGKVQGSGLALVHDKERVLTDSQNMYFEQLVSKIPDLLKLVDITKINGLIGVNPFNLKNSTDNVMSTIINKVECIFPNITSTDGLQQAILDLPRLALQQK